MRIRFKLLIGFVAIAVIVAVVGYLSARTNREIRRQVEHLSRGSIAKVAAATDMAHAIHAVHLHAHKLLLDDEISRGNDDDDAHPIHIVEIKRHVNAFASSLERNYSASRSLIEAAEREGNNELAEYERSHTGQSLQQIETSFTEHRKLLEQFLKLHDTEPSETVEFMNTRLQPHLEETLLPLIAAHKETAEAEFTGQIRGVERSLARENIRDIATTLLALLAAVLLGLVMARAIGRPLETLKSEVNRFGTGDLETDRPIQSSDEIGMLADAFYQMAADLKATTISKEEKELLLKEIHHRVKNNLQIISSLLDMQSTRISDDNVRGMFQESRNRISSMALIHEQLYQSDNMARIDFAQYIQRLADHLQMSFDTPGRGIEMKMDTSSDLLPIDQAIPCGIIVNELVSNAIKHAFPDEAGGQVTIAFHGDNGSHRLAVRDNGIGISDAQQQEPSLGLNVVNALVEQLQGEMQVDHSDGASFVITW